MTDEQNFHECQHQNQISCGPLECTGEFCPLILLFDLIEEMAVKWEPDHGAGGL